MYKYICGAKVQLRHATKLTAASVTGASYSTKRAKWFHKNKFQSYHEHCPVEFSDLHSTWLKNVSSPFLIQYLVQPMSCTHMAFFRRRRMQWGGGGWMTCNDDLITQWCCWICFEIFSWACIVQSCIYLFTCLQCFSILSCCISRPVAH